MRRGQIVWQTGDTRDDLAYRYHVEEDATLKCRWHALWLLRRGFARATVADLLDINPRTLRDWIAWYRQGGCAAISQHHAGGQQGQVCRLSQEQQDALVTQAGQGTFRTIDEVQRWLADTWQVRYTYWGVRSLLDRLHIHAKVPRPRAAGADLEAQDAWKKGG